MKPYLHSGIQALGWSLLFAVVSHYARQELNPFLAIVLTGLLVVAVLIQLFLFRKRGLHFIGTFVVCLALLTVALQYADRRMSDEAKRYYTGTE